MNAVQTGKFADELTRVDIEDGDACVAGKVGPSPVGIQSEVSTAFASGQGYSLDDMVLATRSVVIAQLALC